MSDTENTSAGNGQAEDLTAKVEAYFQSTNPNDLMAALIAMVDRIDELESTVAGLRADLGH